MAYLVAGKILRSTEIKFKLAESELGFSAENQYYAWGETQLWVFIACLSHSTIRVIKTLDKENYFQTHAAGFLTGEKRESIEEIYIL